MCKAMEIESLLYIILGLQITQLLLIAFSAAFVWFKFGRRTFDIVEAANGIMGWAKTLLPNQANSNSENHHITVSHRTELADASTNEYAKILVKGELAQEVYEAMHVFSESNLVRIHAASRKGPEALRRAVNEIDPKSDQLDVIKNFIGPSLLASLAYNYKIDNYYEHGRELSLRRKTSSSGKTTAIFQ